MCLVITSHVCKALRFFLSPCLKADLGSRLCSLYRFLMPPALAGLISGTGLAALWRYAELKDRAPRLIRARPYSPPVRFDDRTTN
jgi:hypothetical protein